jgi:hypothetical protein
MTVTVAATQDITITLPASVLQPASAYLPTPQMERPLRGPWWGVVILFTGLGVLSIVWIWFVLFRNMFG